MTEGTKKEGSIVAVSTAPSINKTPVGDKTPPLPYATFQDLSNSVAVVPNVYLNGHPAYVLEQSIQPSCQGDEPGTKKGVKSGTVSGYVKPKSASSTVTMMGMMAVRIGDSCIMNSGNNPGIYTTAQPVAPNPAKSAAETSNPPIEAETLEEAQAAGMDAGLDPVKEQSWEELKEGVKGILNLVPEAITAVTETESYLKSLGFSALGAMVGGSGIGQGLFKIAQLAHGSDALKEVSNLDSEEMSGAEKAGIYVTMATKIPQIIKAAPTLFANLTAGTGAAVGSEGSVEITSPGDGIVVKPAAAATQCSSVEAGGETAPTQSSKLGEAAKKAGAVAAEKASEVTEEAVSEAPVEEAADTTPAEMAEEVFEVTAEQENVGPAPGLCTSTYDPQKEALLQAIERGDHEAVLNLIKENTPLFDQLVAENANSDYNASLITGAASPVIGNFTMGMLKRYANSIPGVNFDSVLDQADLEVFNNEPVFGIDGLTNGDIYDASMTSAEYLGYAELALSAGSIKAFVRNLGAGNPKYAPNKIDNVSQPGLDKIPLSRTEGLGNHATTQELLDTGAIPGQQGVILDQRTVVFDDIWEMSERSGVEFILTRENGGYILRSGSGTRAPIQPGHRPIIHTHPTDEFGINSLTPSLADIDVLNAAWARNPSGSRPVSQILTGQEQPTRFYATGLEPTPKRNPNKR